MSVQLILYPQHHNGYSFTTQNVFNEYVADGYFANGLDLVSGTTHSQPSHAVLATTIPISAWRGWHSTGGGYSSTTAPSTGSAGLTLTSSSVDTSSTGIFQLIGNLTAGVSYELTITISSFASGMLFLGNVWNSFWTVGGTGYANLANSSTAFVTGSVVAGKITHTFTALGSGDNEVLVLDYQNDNGASLIIDSISIKETQAVPSGIYTDLSDGQVICDLYEDEAIPLSLSIDDFKNVAEKTQSYSKDFHLPNTKRNNKIFSHIFEVTRTTDAFSFNPYVKTKAILKEDSYTLFEGFLQLIDINDKESEISYNVNLYSEVITLADTLKESNLYDLDFTELEHDYTSTQIKNSWNNSGTGVSYNNAGTSGFRDANDTVKYPFIDWTHTFLMDANNLPELNSLEEAFRPCIQVKYLIDRIFQSTPFTFQSTLFDSADFKKLYIDFNWGGDNAPFDIQNTENARTNVSTLAGGSYTTMPQANNNFNSDFGYSAGVYTAQYDNQTYDISFIFTTRLQNPTGSPQTFTGDSRWKIVKGGVTTYSNIQSFTSIIPASTTQDAIYSGSLVETLEDGDTLTPEFKESIAGSILWTSEPSATTGQTFDTVVSISSPIITTSIILQTLRGELSQWEFLKGIMTMFNLISISDRDNPNNIIIEPYADVFITNSDSTKHNWTDKVDVSEINLKPLSKLTKKTIFKFVEDEDDYAFNNYKNSVGGHLYGSKIYDASALTLLTGEEEIIAEPYAATVSKPLMPYLTNFIVPAIYSLNDDGTTEGFENEPRILYNNGVKTLQVANTYKIPAQNGVVASTETDFLQFSHLTDIPTIVSSPPVATDTRDFHFGECQLIQPIGDATINNLYNIYYSPYYDELYNSDTRIMTMKVNLTPADIQNFKFYDTVVVKNREYRVNKIEYKPNTLAKVEFILIP